MTKKLFVYLMAMIMTVHLSGCTSGGSMGEDAQSADSEFSQEGEGDFAQDGGENPQDQIAGDEGEPAQGEAPQDNGQDLALDEQEQGQKPSADGESGQELALDDQEAKPAGGDELSLDEPQALPEEIAQNQEAPAPAPVAEPVAEAPAPIAPTDEKVFQPEPAAPVTTTEEPVAAPEAMAATEEKPAAPKVFAPLQKVKAASFEMAGVNLNRVYLARPGDTAKSVSEKIYGTNRSKDLKKWNPILARGMKTGDKIYYQSPSNPEDTQMLNFYEEKGVAPNVYTSKEGDNIRAVARELLGTKDSWKEVWSTNLDIESKGDIPAGLEIRYWPESAIASAPPQQPSGAGDGEMTSSMPPSMPMETAPPPPGDQIAMNEPVPPPPPPPTETGMGAEGNPDPANGAAGVVNTEPPPPPPPPPPEPQPVAKKASAEDFSEGEDETMVLVLGGVLMLAAAALFVILRRNRAKRLDLGQTQV